MTTPYTFKGQVAELVDDQELRLRVKHQAVAQLAVGFGFGQRRQQGRGAGEEDGVAGFDDGAPEGDREMRFADAGGAEDQYVFGRGEKSGRGQLADESLIDRRLEFELKVIEDGDTSGRLLVLCGTDEILELAVDDLSIEHRAQVDVEGSSSLTFDTSGRPVSIAIERFWLHVAASTRSGLVRIWKTGMPFRTFQHREAVSMMTFDADGRLLATASDDGTARLWDVDGNRELYRIGKGSPAFFVQFSADGKSLATIFGDGTVRVVSTEQPAHVRAFDGGASGLPVLLASDGSGDTLLIAGERRATIEGPAGTPSEVTLMSRVEAVALSDQGGYVAIASRGNLAVYRRADMNVSMQVTVHGVRSVGLTPDGRFVAAGTEDGEAIVWEVASGRRVTTLAPGNIVYAVAFLGNGETLMTGGENATRTVALLQLTLGRSCGIFMPDESLLRWPWALSCRPLLYHREQMCSQWLKVRMLYRYGTKQLAKRWRH